MISPVVYVILSAVLSYYSVTAAIGGSVGMAYFHGFMACACAYIAGWKRGMTA